MKDQQTMMYEEILSKMLSKHRPVINWFENVYFKTPEHERQEIDHDWDTFYQECYNSPEALLTREMVKAYKAGDSDRFTDLASQAQQMRKNGITKIVRPQGYDPYLWHNSQDLRSYRVAKAFLKNDKSELEQEMKKSGLAW